MGKWYQHLFEEMPEPSNGPDTLHVLGWVVLVVALFTLIYLLFGGWRDLKWGGHDVYHSIASVAERIAA